MCFKISVIIPAYNCEQYIGRCLNSVLKQKYDNIEVIIVNDGSVDQTEKIISKYRDERIILINKKNSGVSDSRNLGIEKATGDYITFVDADDYLDENIYSDIFSNGEFLASDMIMFGYSEHYGEQKKEIYFPWEEKIRKFDKNNINQDLIPKMIANLKNEENYIMGAVWRIIIKKEIAQKVKFNVNLPIAEDLIFCIDCINNSNFILAYNKCLYNYVKNNGSATERYKNDFEETNRKFHEIFIRKLQKIGITPEIRIRYGINKMVMYTLTFSNIVKKPKEKILSKYEKIKEIAKICNKDEYITKDILRHLNFERKIVFIMLKLKCYIFITLLFQLKEFRKRRNL